MTIETRRALPEKTVLHLASGEQNFAVTAELVIGFGGSCLVYRGHMQDALGEHRVIIKELCPKSISPARREDNSLAIPAGKAVEFAVWRENFQNGQKNHRAYYKMAADTSLPGAFLFGEANNTLYAVSDPGAGTLLADISRESLTLHRVAVIMESLCAALTPIHQHEQLYLDCKPENIFLYHRGQEDHVRLFDFDTLTDRRNFTTRKYRFCSYSLGWAAPEQVPLAGETDYANPFLIGYHTDLFSVGQVFLWLLTGKKPDRDTTSLARIQDGLMDWRRESSLCRDASEEAVEQVQIIAQKLLEPDAKKRRETFGRNTSIREVGALFEALYGYTAGNDPHYAPIYDNLTKTREDLLSAQKESETTLRQELRDTAETVKRASFGHIFFGSKKRAAVTICCLAAVLGLTLWLGSFFLRPGTAPLAAGFDSHLVMELSNANHHYSMGLEKWQQQRFVKAEEDLSAAREELSALVAESETESAKVSNSLGCLYLDMGRYEEAYDCLMSAYTAFKKELGVDSPAARAVQFSLGQYAYFTGDFEGAVKEAEHIRDHTGKKERVLLTAVDHLCAMAKESMGDYAGAMKTCQAVLPLYDEFLQDKDETDTLAGYVQDASLSDSDRMAQRHGVEWLMRMYEQMGRLYLREKRYPEAKDALQAGLALADSNKYIKVKNLTTARLHMHMARVWMGLGDLWEAKIEVDLALHIEENLFEQEDTYPGLSEVYRVYGDVSMAEGDSQAAGNHYREALAKARTGYGDHHPQTAEAHDALGWFLLQTGESAPAAEQFEASIGIWKDLLKADHPAAVQSYLHLATAELKLGDMDAARENLKMADYLCEKAKMDPSGFEEMASLREQLS